MPDISRLFDRYVQQHLDVTLPGQPILAPGGQVLGYAEAVRLQGSRVTVTGWAQVDDITLSMGEHSDCVAPSIHRSDVNAALDCDPSMTLGYGASLPMMPGEIWLTARRGDATYSAPLLELSEADIMSHRKSLRPAFLRRLASASPVGALWLLTRAPRHRATLKRKLGLEARPATSTVCPTLFAEAQPTAPPAAEITIVLPVYNAFDLLPEVLQRVIDHTDLNWKMIIVEDCSSDQAVRPYLRSWLKGLPRFLSSKITLVENPENLGFIRSVNKALKLAMKHRNHVVLLNSDALVPEGWASRLLRPMLDDGQVATVTPMSNDAEIFTAPAICNRIDLTPGEADVIDKAAQRLHPQATLSGAPTGVGFCMSMNRSYLKRLPRLDTVFGRGYGEEVDWCQKARALGGAHLVTPTLFVEHRGGASFGSEAKQKLIAKNNAHISKRYPTYDAEVQEFIKIDPIAPARMVLGVALSAARQKGPMPIYLGHVMGGGAEDDLLRRIDADLKRDHAAIVLRVGGEHPWRVDLHGPWGVTQAQFSDFEDVRQVLQPVTDRKVVYSCAVGGSHPLQIPGQLKQLAAGGTAVTLVHDYFMVSPSYTLLNSDGSFSGVPNTEYPNRAHSWGPTSLAEWQAAWHPFLSACTEIEVFSESSAQIISRAYPDCAEKVSLRPHKLISPVGKVPPKDGPRVIGVLGNIGFQKGAEVLSQLSVDLAREETAGLVIIGNLDPSFPLHPSAQIHGSYDRKDIPNLTRDYGITDWLIPSIWPETFSFTTHEALATGLPVWTFDLGAQADAVRAAENGGGVIELDGDKDPASQILAAISDGSRTEAA
ncbi:glycosyltransferase [Actibacterium pelagium]|uniref:Glycosyltransferase, GT2 family n=1 Tax=Actibacterium pelagium TaxID=2029103 RepID=A0A917AHW4_9RHOB|nr:glycosyltransferase [Actibacterium pelagium]GGE54915.1 hypothetical protein GCM10011517_23230 [Actibacterium pelagium]